MNAQPSIIPGARALTRQDLEAHWMPFSANRNFKNQPRLLSHAKGVHYWTPEGRQILDGVAGLWCSTTVCAAKVRAPASSPVSAPIMA